MSFEAYSDAELEAAAQDLIIGSNLFASQQVVSEIIRRWREVRAEDETNA